MNRYRKGLFNIVKGDNLKMHVIPHHNKETR